MSQSEASLRLTVFVETITDPADAFPVTARFENTSSATVRMLELFEPLPVFFTPSLSRADGGEIDVAGAGKVDPFDGSLAYNDLAPGESLSVGVDLAPWIRAPVTPGLYRLSLTYHNAYGSNCFRGPLASPPVIARVEGTR
jgi:hypothetical protein